MNITRSFCIASAAAVVAVLGMSTAYAIPVTYRTEGFIDGAKSQTFGGSTISFIDFALDTVEPGPMYPSFTQIELGSFLVDSATAFPGDDISTTFRIEIYQTAPLIGDTEFAGTIEGSLWTAGGQLFYQFTAPFVRILANSDFATVYRVPTGPQPFSNGTTVDNRTTDIKAEVASTDNPSDIPGIPEPASMILFGMGGIGLLGGAVRRRRAEKAAA